MPDQSKFLQIKSMLDSLSKAVADYESDYAKDGSSSYEKDPYNDEDNADGGQDPEVLTGFSQPKKTSGKSQSQPDDSGKGQNKKERMSMMSSFLKKKMGSY